jgi:hypothetical protein
VANLTVLFMATMHELAGSHASSVTASAIATVTAKAQAAARHIATGAATLSEYVPAFIYSLDGSASVVVQAVANLSTYVLKWRNVEAKATYFDEAGAQKTAWFTAKELEVKDCGSE